MQSGIDKFGEMSPRLGTCVPVQGSPTGDLAPPAMHEIVAEDESHSDNGDSDSGDVDDDDFDEDFDEDFEEEWDDDSDDDDDKFDAKLSNDKDGGFGHDAPCAGD